MPEKNIKLMIAYLLILFSYVFTLGFYSLGSIAILLIAFVFLITLFFSPKNSPKTVEKQSLITFLKIILFTSILISLVVHGGLYQIYAAPYKISVLILFICSLLSISYITNARAKLIKYRFNILFISALVMQVLMIISSPHPKIDVFDQLKYGSEGLIRLENPYAKVYPQIYDYPQDYFPYLPATALVVLPFNLILGDPRFSLIAGYALSALIFKKILSKSDQDVKELIPLIFLFNPRATFITEQAWIDPLIFTAFIAFIYSLETKKNNWLSGILLGITISLKQTFPLMLIFLFAYKKISKKILIISVFILLFTILPFYLWNKTDFVNDVIKIHLERRLWWHNSLTINSLIFSEFKFDVNKNIFPFVWIALMILIIKRGVKDLTNLTFSICFWFFSFYLFNYQAYIHYYQFISNMILLTTTLSIINGNKHQSIKKENISSS